MNKTLSVATICLAVAVVVLALALVRGRSAASDVPKLGTPYQAVVLDTGVTLFGKVSRLGTEFPEMTGVYNIVNTQDPQTKQVKTVLVEHAKAAYAPAETYLDARHILMIEPVGPSSKVAQLIAQSESQASNQPQQK